MEIVLDSIENVLLSRHQRNCPTTHSQVLKTLRSKRMLEMRHFGDLKLLIFKSAKKFLLSLMIKDGYKKFIKISSKTLRIHGEIIAYKLGYKWYLLEVIQSKGCKPCRGSCGFKESE